jgi:hypothetical protein
LLEFPETGGARILITGEVMQRPIKGMAVGAGATYLTAQTGERDV